MITVTALKWAPPFATGNVRDHRARWILNEVGWPYQVRLLDMPTLKSGEYRTQQPFGQVPAMLEDGKPPVFESGAIVLDVAMRAGKLIPEDPTARTQVLAYYIAALNSIEPYLQNVAEVEYFIQDEDAKKQRRPSVLKMAHQRLAELEKSLGDRAYLVGDEFTVADLITASVLKIAKGLNLIGDYPKLAAYQERCLDRPAYKKAIADQKADIAAHTMADMVPKPS